MDQSSKNGGKPSWNKSPVVIAVIALVAIIAAVVIARVWLSQYFDSGKESEETASSAERELYGALGNAASQQRLRVGMYRETFANKADADSRKNIGSIASSVSEVDVQAGKYRSVYAHNRLEADGSFSVGRCMDGTTYSEIYSFPATNTQRAKTLPEAADRLKLVPEGNLFEVTQPLRFIPCPYLGLLPAAPPIAVARLSDGVFPVTLTDQQAKAWQEKLEAADLFDVTDEGIVERHGAELRKISFTPKDKADTNEKLHEIFYRAGDIARIKSEQPDAQVDYEFQPINPANTGAVGGYYLIDAAKNLPVYSELYGTNEDKDIKDSRAARLNVARTKQTYEYPAQLTLSLDTRLQFLD